MDNKLSCTPHLRIIFPFLSDNLLFSTFKSSLNTILFKQRNIVTVKMVLSLAIKVWFVRQCVCVCVCVCSNQMNGNQLTKDVLTSITLSPLPAPCPTPHNTNFQLSLKRLTPFTRRQLPPCYFSRNARPKTPRRRRRFRTCWRLAHRSLWRSCWCLTLAAWSPSSGTARTCRRRGSWTPSETRNVSRLWFLLQG